MRQPSGHWVFYNHQGLRILYADPAGHPLHECEWSEGESAIPVLLAARMCLDWGQWVGIKPEGLIHHMTLNLSARPGWEHITRQDLRHMAAQAMGVPLSEVEFFYRDEDVLIDAHGVATIRHRKDAFYILEDGDFERVRFMSCMGAMHWGRIDFLPVVELFQSLLPGTGSVTFELIRGLYDDQNKSNPLPLHYRGMPVYPSPAAYGLFSQFFSPSVDGELEAFHVFMDPSQSHRVSWLPRQEFPIRFFMAQQDCTLTVHGSRVQKVTCGTDSTGLPFVPPNADGFAPCERAVTRQNHQLCLSDGSQRKILPLDPAWGLSPATDSQVVKQYPFGWRALFPDGVPQVEPAQAFSAVLLYPDNEAPIEELACQPFVADYLEDLFEQDPGLGRHLQASDQVLIDQFDGVIGTCILLDRPRSYTVLFARPAYAQKHAQALWNLLVRTDKLEWGRAIQFQKAQVRHANAYHHTYDLIYRWFPFNQYRDQAAIEAGLKETARALAPGGYALLAGPEYLSEFAAALELEIEVSHPVSTLPTFQMHLNILPRATINPQLYLSIVRRCHG